MMPGGTGQGWRGMELRRGRKWEEREVWVTGGTKGWGEGNTGGDGGGGGGKREVGGVEGVRGNGGKGVDNNGGESKVGTG